jgi:hypothetical protein
MSDDTATTRRPRMRRVRENDRCCCGEIWDQHQAKCSCSHFWCARGQSCILHCGCPACVGRHGQPYPRREPGLTHVPYRSRLDP